MIPVPATLESAWLKVLVSQRDSLVARDTARVPLDCNLQLPPVYFDLLVPKDQQAKRKIIKLAGPLAVDNSENRGMILHGKGSEEVCVSPGDPLGGHLLFPCTSPT